MDEKIKIVYENEEEGATEVLNKLKAEQKVLELFETKEIEKIEIKYKKESQLVLQLTQMSKCYFLSNQKLLQINFSKQILLITELQKVYRQNPYKMKGYLE